MKCKYRMRWFSSKGAFLVLLWTLLLATACSFNMPVHIHSSNWLYVIPILVTVVAAPLSGWLADAKFGNYKVFRVGILLLFSASVLRCSLLILGTLVWKSSYVLEWIQTCLVVSLFAVGCCACIVTALPLGLDQMPDASSSSITSFIAWFVCIIFIGVIFNRFLFCFKKCLAYSTNLNLIFALLSTIFFYNFVFNPKWLIIEPNSPQSLKNFYRILKFAAKHKAPLNRSAFTYWEEDIPSRIDLGKSKYGGPFTTEQVEDVKTVLRLLAISSPLFFVVLSLIFRYNEDVLSDNSSVASYTKCAFLSNPLIYAITTTLVNEFIVYPLANNRLQLSILKRIGAVPLILTFVTFVCLLLELFHYFSDSNENTTKLIVIIFYNCMDGILSQVLFTSLLEFICAQSPYNMRGLLPSFVSILLLTSLTVRSEVTGVLKRHLHNELEWRVLILFSLKTFLCLTGFLLFCVVARWYKLDESER